MRRALAVAAVLALSACGSTVQVQGTGQVPADGTLAGTTGEVGTATTSGTTGLGGTTGGSGGTTTGAVAGPSGSTGGGTSGTTSGTVPAPVATVAPPSKRVTGPVQIGFVNTSAGNAEAAGLNMGQTYTTDQVFRGLVNAMNAKGGLGGRKIVPVTASTDTAAADWASQFQAACATFTQDHKVAAVIGYVFGFFANFESCLAKKGVVHLDGGYNVSDQADLDAYPTLYATNALTADRRFLLQATGAVREGFLTPTNKLGILIDECPSSQRALKRTTLPYLKAQGIVVAKTNTFRCPGGATDAGSAASQTQAAVLSFRNAGVDRVFTEGIPLVLFAQAAESQGYRPGYLVTSTSNGAALQPNIPAAQAANVHGYGWMPMVDVSLSQTPPKTAPQQRCLALLASQGIKPSQYNDYLAAYTTCDGLFLYERALALTNGATDAGLVTAALNGLGKGYAGVGVYQGRTLVSRSQRDLPTAYRPWGWSTGCSCFVYKGGELPIP